MAYLSTAVVKSDWLRIDSSDSSMDTIIGRMVAAAEDEIEGILNQPVEATSLTMYWDGMGEIEHNLLYTVPVSATQLRYRLDPSIAWSTAAGTSYAVRSRYYGASLWYAEGFTPFTEYEFTAQVGWLANNVPADILAAGYELVKELYLETPYAGQAERFGVSGISEGQGGTTFSKSIMRMRPIIAEKLQRYRLLVL